MTSLIEDKREAIVHLWERFEARRRAPFGSMTESAVDPATSNSALLWPISIEDRVLPVASWGDRRA